MKFARIARKARSAKHVCLIPSTKDVHRGETNRSKDHEKTGDEETTYPGYYGMFSAVLDFIDTV